MMVPDLPPAWLALLHGLPGRERRAAPTTVTSLTVGTREVVMRHVVGRRPSVTVLQGEAWVTQADDRQDHCLRVGDVVHLRRRGRVAIQGLGRRPCRLELHDLG